MVWNFKSNENITKYFILAIISTKKRLQIKSLQIYTRLLNLMFYSLSSILKFRLLLIYSVCTLILAIFK